MIKKIKSSFLYFRIGLGIRSKHIQFWKKKAKPKSGVILTYGRTGSTWLSTLLAYHPDTMNYGETNTIESLLKKVQVPIAMKLGFGKYNYHLEFPDDLSTIEEFDFILHMTRNPVEVYVSQMIAEDTGVWSESVTDRKTEQGKIRIDIGSLLAFIKVYEETIIKVDAHIKNLNFKKLNYHDLYNDPRSILHEIQVFLKLEPKTLKSGLRKQIDVKYSDLIVNYDEVINSLKDNQLARLLVE